MISGFSLGINEIFVPSVILRRVDSEVNDVSEPIGPIFKGHAKRNVWTARPLKIEPIDCPETSIKNYQSTQRTITEERISTDLNTRPIPMNIYISSASASNSTKLSITLVKNDGLLHCIITIITVTN